MSNWKKTRWLTPVLALALGLLGASCDCFLDIPGTLTECGGSTPIGAADITVRVDKGFQGRSYMGVVTYHTDAAGKFKVTAGETCDSWVTLFFKKDGFVPVELPVKGRPKQPLAVCLTRATP